MSVASIQAPGLFKDALALIPFAGGAVVGAADGNSRRVGLEEARKLFRAGGVLVAHAAFVSGRLKTPPSAPLADVLELFAFVRPAQFCVPSPRGLARALGLVWPESDEDAARTLHLAARQLMQELQSMDARMHARLAPLAANLVAAGWRWGPEVAAAVGANETPKSPIA